VLVLSRQANAPQMDLALVQLFDAPTVALSFAAAMQQNGRRLQLGAPPGPDVEQLVALFRGRLEQLGAHNHAALVQVTGRRTSTARPTPAARGRAPAAARSCGWARCESAPARHSPRARGGGCGRQRRPRRRAPSADSGTDARRSAPERR
jgi:hypothetical protein